MTIEQHTLTPPEYLEKMKEISVPDRVAHHEFASRGITAMFDRNKPDEIYVLDSVMRLTDKEHKAFLATIFSNKERLAEYA